MLPADFWLECLRVIATSIPAATAVVAGVKAVTAQQVKQGEQIAVIGTRMTALEIGQSVLMAHHGLLERVSDVSNALSPARNRREGDPPDESARESTANPAAAAAAAANPAAACPAPGAVTIPDPPTVARYLTARAKLLDTRGV
jgi:hypothetical protein